MCGGGRFLLDKTAKKIDIHRLNNKNITRFLIRLSDIILSVIGLVVLLPLLLCVAILIKFDDPSGPIIFKQIRIGKYGKKFEMYKFRSMVINAEEKLDSLLQYNEMEGAMFKIKDDPRITKIGKFIRKTSIDELPQLFNVIKGDMSLVGPRPPLPREVDMYTEFDKQRLLIKPGCTGLWQINGRNDLNFDDMINLDIEYINNFSIILYFKVIFKTILILFKLNGA